VPVDRLVHTRRAVLGAAAGLAAAALTGSCRSRSGSPPNSRRLRVMMNGGIYEEHARRLVVGPFERDTGASIEVVPGSTARVPPNAGELRG
jgi:hypothetical protein